MTTNSPPEQRTPEEIQQQFHAGLGKILHEKPETLDKTRLDQKRYRKVRWFFARLLLDLLWWDVIINRPLLSWLRPEPLPRWQRWAIRYRELALEMGGVLIKLGQFLSVRVDILPPEVTGELAGLQDAVPPVPFPEIKAQIEADFQKPLAEVYAWFDPEPLGAASLSQAHRAGLASGETVVVKVLRPGIDILVETDLAAIALALTWLKLYRYLNTRVNLNRLADEFTTVTRNELDFAKEGQNAEQFAADFADDPQMYTPKVFWAYSAARTLTLENVGYIKIGDLQALDAAGIHRPDVAKKFFHIYSEQCLVNNFVHADPHPGNVFIKPLRHPDEPEETVFKPGDPVPYKPNRPFQVVFVDFGMMADIPEKLRASIREYTIGFGTKDAYRVIQSFRTSDTLLPGADIKRLEEAHEAIFERFWGVQMGKFSEIALEETQFFMREYRDLINEAPFQFPVDMLFAFRAIGLLSGMATNLDPEFDPWAEWIVWAEKLAQDDIQQNWRGWLGEAAAFGQLLYKLPNQLERTLTQAHRGDLAVKTALAPDARKMLTRLEQSVNRLTWVVLAVGLLIAGLLAEGQVWYADWLTFFAVIAFLWGMFRTG